MTQSLWEMQRFWYIAIFGHGINISNIRKSERFSSLKQYLYNDKRIVYDAGFESAVCGAIRDYKKSRGMRQIEKYIDAYGYKVDIERIRHRLNIVLDWVQSNEFHNTEREVMKAASSQSGSSADKSSDHGQEYGSPCYFCKGCGSSNGRTCSKCKGYGFLRSKSAGVYGASSDGIAPSMRALSFQPKHYPRERVAEVSWITAKDLFDWGWRPRFHAPGVIYFAGSGKKKRSLPSKEIDVHIGVWSGMHWICIDGAESLKAGTSSDQSAANPAEKARRSNTSFMKAMRPSAALAAIVGESPIPRTEVAKRVWKYIKQHGLQDSKDRTFINADAKFRKVLTSEKVSIFEMNKIIERHLK